MVTKSNLGKNKQMMYFNRGVHEIDNRKIEYVSFGMGEPLLIIPGIGDGLSTIGVRSIEEFMFYFNYGIKYRVVIASRAEPVKKEASIKDMAWEYISLMDALGHTSYYLIGKSMGGMIAQYMAYYAKNTIKKAVFAVTVPYADENLCKILEKWIYYASHRKYLSLRIHMFNKTYLPVKALIYIANIYLTGFLYWPKDFKRFLKHAKACYDFDARNILSHITIPTLVISGAKDEIMLPELGEELAVRLPRSNLIILDNVGHGAFDDNKNEFDSAVFNFLNSFKG